MALVEAITNLTTLVTQMAQAQQQQPTAGLTPEQAAQLAQVSADNVALREALAGLRSSQQTMIGALTTHTGQLTALAQQLAANGQNDAKLLAAIGDLTGFGA